MEGPRPAALRPPDAAAAAGLPVGLPASCMEGNRTDPALFTQAFCKGDLFSPSLFLPPNKDRQDTNQAASTPSQDGLKPRISAVSPHSSVWSREKGVKRKTEAKG